MGRFNKSLVLTIQTISKATHQEIKMTLEEIVATEEVAAPVEAPQPDAGRKVAKKAKKVKKAKKAKKAAKKGRKAAKKSRKVAKKGRKARKVAKKAKKAKKSKKVAKKAKKQTKRQRRHARRAANKRARGGKTIAQCVMAVMKSAKRCRTAGQIRKALAKAGCKVGIFVLSKVLARMVRRRVLHSVKGKLSLTGRRLPKAKAPRALRRNRKGRFMKPKGKKATKKRSQAAIYRR